MDPNHKKEHEQLREKLLAITREIFQIEDTSGIELFGVLGRTAHLSEMVDSQFSEELDLSGPRWRLLMRLFAEERMGNTAGITPTSLSHHQRVTKNTISALLRGLEEQGLIQRALDPDDLRVFRIQLTDAGRELVIRTAPRRVEGLNQLLSGFSKAEIRQMIGLLERLQSNLMAALHDKDLLNK